MDAKLAGQFANPPLIAATFALNVALCFCRDCFITAPVSRPFIGAGLSHSHLSHFRGPSHFPPGTSKWNTIEHRMVCHITNNWRGRPLVSREVVVNLIGCTTTEAGLHIRSQLDENTYETGLKVSDEELAELALERDEFHGEWNYRLRPREKLVAT